MNPFIQYLYIFPIICRVFLQIQLFFFWILAIVPNPSPWCQKTWEIQAGLQVIQEGIDEVKVDQFEPLDLKKMNGSVGVDR